jgi:hypothetical protein
MATESPLLFDALPTVAAALERSLAEEGEHNLARSLREARVHALCECGASDCMSFYLSEPRSPCPGKYRVVLPSAVMTVGVCDERIEWVQDEALDEDDETSQRLREYRNLLGAVPRAPASGH